MKIGVFGGTFNPVHNGHLRAAEEARERLSLDKVLFVPSGVPPLKSRDLAPASLRLEMVARAVAGNPYFEVIDLECRKPGKSFTVRTLELLGETYRGADLAFLLGIDAFLDIPNWREPERLITLADFVILSRPGGKFASLCKSPYLRLGRKAAADLDKGAADSLSLRLSADTAAVLMRIMPLAISSSDLRERLGKRHSIKYLLPEEVESFIISKNLYQ